jgi:hypothetical protein
MTTQLNVQPVRYSPQLEIEEEGEDKTTRGLVETLTKISTITFKDSGHATRSVHAKSHGLIVGELRVLDNLSPELAQGIFSRVAIFPVVMRLSTIPGDVLDDAISTPRGIGIKVIGVEGERLQGSEGDKTQDFVLVNGPVFAAPGPKKFLGTLKVLAATTDKAPGVKKAIATAFRGLEKVVEAAGGKSATLTTLGGHPETHILGETFYSQAPILFGPYMAKVCLVPVSPELKQLVHAPLDFKGDPNALRGAVSHFFKTTTAEWELRIQLCTNLETMPIEDASVQWPENESPYVAVARITARPQETWSTLRSASMDDGLSFSLWHGIADHRPIGAVMRVRKQAYAASVAFRESHNGRRIVEPKAISDLRIDE